MPDQSNTNNAPLRLAVLIGSTRLERFGPTVAKCFVAYAQNREEFGIDLIDLADLALPSALVSDTTPAMDDYLARLARADAFVVVTPEYNHGYPASLKAAIDLADEEWHAKPVGFVGYGGISGGIRAIEQLKPVFAEMNAVAVREAVLLPYYRKIYDANEMLIAGTPSAAMADRMLNRLAWWGYALRDARAARPFAANVY
ncbi:NAD(P)H-dependent oxidoreductase [bacterium]|nr:NAD(P)H-dependent oxidoreductase [bacterium]